MTDTHTQSWTKADDAMVENAIRRGATRRELMQLLLAGGVALTMRRQGGHHSNLPGKRR